jgi:hypothetical protein
LTHPGRRGHDPGRVIAASQAATLGVPQLQVSAGPTDVILHPDGSVSGHPGNIIRDICAELGAS